MTQGGFHLPNTLHEKEQKMRPEYSLDYGIDARDDEQQQLPHGEDYFSGDHVEGNTHSLEEQCWPRDEELSSLRTDPDPSCYNSRVFSGTCDELTESNAADPPREQGSEDTQWLREKHEELLREPIDASSIDEMDAYDIISCLELLSTWLTKDDDELIASGISSDILEDNFEILVDAWEAYR